MPHIALSMIVHETRTSITIYYGIEMSDVKVKLSSLFKTHFNLINHKSVRTNPHNSSTRIGEII